VPTEEFLRLLSALQAKGNQLKLMESGLDSDQLRIPVYSPSSNLRKTKALSILRELREAGGGADGQARDVLDHILQDSDK
jgi:hypothetical protein